MAKYDYRNAGDADIQPPSRQPWPETPYILPFIAFLLVMLPGSFDGTGLKDFWKLYTPFFYSLKTAAAAVLLWYFWPCYTRIRWTRLWLGVIFGIVGTFLWIGTELAARKFGIAVPPHDADIYNPDKELGGGWREALFLCIRIVGPSLVVPVMEELFFRDFLMRSVIAWGRRISFQEIPVGAFSWASLLVMSALFGLNHGINRWFFAGFVYGILMGILLIRTKSLGACIVAHGVTNLTLYLYVVYSGDWQWM